MILTTPATPTRKRPPTVALILGFLMLLLAPQLPGKPDTRLRFRVHLPEAASEKSVTGRITLFVAKGSAAQPSENYDFRFAADVEGLAPGQSIEIDADTPGLPIQRLGDLPEEHYTVQAVCDVYTLFHRSDGRNLWLPDVSWGGARTQSKPGNLISEVLDFERNPKTDRPLELTLQPTVAEEPRFVDTKWVKRVKIQSKALSAFWGRPVFIGAVVTLPRGYEQRPDKLYPVNYQHGWGGLSSGGLEEGTPLFDEWMADDFPRMIAVRAYMPSPYFGNGHAVDSANMGPWGEAYFEELIPYLESRFRIIREPWARTLSGGSTGGWIALSLQLRHPQFFGGMWSWNPDPVDFRRLGLLDIYKESNAFTTAGGRERSVQRDVFGQQLDTVREAVRSEQMDGSKGRSRGQFDAYHALFGPVGDDGYPRPLWNPATGSIDQTIATYWGDHYDLLNHLKSNWTRVGPDLERKLHIFCGEMDDYFSNEALYGLEKFLESTTDPYYDGQFVWGRPRKGHGWTPWDPSNGELFRIMAKHISAAAPPGIDTGLRDD